jgi:Peptidase inhibitor family I36
LEAFMARDASAACGLHRQAQSLRRRLLLFVRIRAPPDPPILHHALKEGGEEMKLLRNLAVLTCIAVVALAASGVANAGAKQGAQRLAVDPNAVTFSNGDLGITFLGPLSTDSLSQCTSGYFCFWGSTGFAGTFYHWSADGWHDLHGFAGPFKSLYNHRSRTAYVHQSSQGPPEFCTDPGLEISSMNSAYWHAGWLYLASSQTACG